MSNTIIALPQQIAAADTELAAINALRDRLRPFAEQQRLRILSEVLASVLCECGGRNASAVLAARAKGLFDLDVASRINQVFPRSDGEGIWR